MRGATLRIGLCLAVLLMGEAAQATDPGAKAWRSNCVRCHSDAAIVIGLLPKDIQAAREELERKLKSHHIPIATEREAVIAWLLARMAK